MTRIGGDCAKDRFDAGSIAIADRRRAENEIARLDADAKLQAFLQDRDARVSALEASFRELQALPDRLRLIEQAVVLRVWNAVQTAAR